MRRLLFLILAVPLFLNAQNDTIKYTLIHAEYSKSIKIVMELDSINTANAFLTIPRSAPGTYEITDYQKFISNVKAVTTNDEIWKGHDGFGSYFFFKEDGYIKSISYEVDVQKMESELTGAFASSKLRNDYLGVLGYSVFGFLRGLQEHPIHLTIKSDANWPIFTTLAPEKRTLGSAKYEINNYPTLVDAQYLLGNGVQLFKVADTEIPLFVAVYSEVPIDIEEIGRRGKLSLEGLSNYFGFIPMPHYTMCYEFLDPFSENHDYGFSIEHMNSMTASLDTAKAVTQFEADARIGSIVHHMGHSWIPLRSYGVGYRPFDWESAPIIETIWLNEGFIWYVMTEILEADATIKFFQREVNKAPAYIQNKSLKELSQLGSTQYSADFNIGKNLFSRGALMAQEMDAFIQQETNGKRSFKDALLGLMNWTEQNQRGFEYEEIEPILSGTTGVHLKDIWQKWQR